MASQRGGVRMMQGRRRSKPRKRRRTEDGWEVGLTHPTAKVTLGETRKSHCHKSESAVRGCSTPVLHFWCVCVGGGASWLWWIVLVFWFSFAWWSETGPIPCFWQSMWWCRRLLTQSHCYVRDLLVDGTNIHAISLVCLWPSSLVHLTIYLLEC